MANIKDVALYFLHLDSRHDGEGLSNLKLQKLAYYAQGFYLAVHGKVLFDEPLEAWTHGPVVPTLYHEYKHYSSGRIKYLEDFNAAAFSKDEMDMIEDVFKEFGQYSAWKLRNMTHEEPTWMDYETNYSVIPVNHLQEYFSKRLA
jgi:uncharacterized phage-associated protein